jgi:hypothetical protein
MGNNCLDCQRPMRTRLTPVADFPGTVRLGGRGLCYTCHTRHTRNGTLDSYTPRQRGRAAEGTAECTTCKRHIRPGSTTLEQWPGTVKGTMGRCGTCHALHIRGVTPEGVKRTADALAHYLDWRRPYRAKAGAL